VEFHKLNMSKGLGKDVSDHVFSRVINDSGKMKVNKLANEMETSVDVLGMHVESRVFG